MKRVLGFALASALAASAFGMTPAFAAIEVNAKDPANCFYEGDAPEKRFGFRVALSSPATETVTVDYSTSEGDAKFGKDFLAKAGTLTFAAGEKVKTIRISVVDDNRNEKDAEFFFVNLSSAQGASLGDTTAAGSICNDDPLPMIDVSDVTVDEQIGDTQFPVSLTQRSGRKVTLFYEAGTSSNDYIAESGKLVWPAGMKTRNIKMSTLGDWYDEPTESFTVNLFGGTNVGSPEVDTWSFKVKIKDDDPPPSISVDDLQINESDAVLGSPIPIPISWIGETEKKTPTVSYRLVRLYGDGDPQEAWDATEGIDYENSGPVELQMAMSASVYLIHDSDAEYNESFRIELFDPFNAQIVKDSATITIMDDDIPGYPT